MSPPRPLRVTVSLLLSFGLLACTSQTVDNFENPPPGPPAACAPNPAVVGCTGGSLGYTCSGDRPDDGDANFVCSDGTPGAAGMTIFCCAPYGQYWSSCTVDSGVAGCVADSFGFRCSGPETPDEADGSIVCGAGTPSGGDMVYCCNSAVLSPTCAADPTVPGCEGASIGYSCAGTDVPDQSDASLACSVATAAKGGTTQYCCIPFAQSSGTCQKDDAVPGCSPSSYGFSCQGSTTPAELDPALVCAPGKAGSFCCDLATK